MPGHCHYDIFDISVNVIAMTQKFSDADVLARKRAVVTAATELFKRHGYARTTMADLATAANLSRPALYLAYPGKDEIFAAVIEYMSAEKLDEFRRSLPKLRTLGSRLHRFCEEWGAHGLELTDKHPDARDLFDLSFPPVREMYESFIRFVADLLIDAGCTDKSKATPEEIARNLVYSFRGLKEAAPDATRMRRMIRLQVDLLLAALQL